MSQKVPFGETKENKINAVKANHSFKWWESVNPVEKFWGQAHEPMQLVPTEEFQRAADQSLARSLKPDELNSPHMLVSEPVDNLSKATLVDLIHKMGKIASAEN